MRLGPETGADDEREGKNHREASREHQTHKNENKHHRSPLSRKPGYVP